jgi:nucleoside-diphosphate-sugar epimerase
MPVKPLSSLDLEHVLTQTRELWLELHGKSFFITGGTGFFGMWLLESFAYINDKLSLGATTTVLTRDPAAFTKKAPHLAARRDLTFIKGDIRDFNFPQGSFHYLIHAAVDGTAKSQSDTPHQILPTSVEGMRRILAFAAEAQIEKLLLTSSGAVYGTQPSNLTHLPEDFHGAPDSLNPTSAYGEAKRIKELMAAIHTQHNDTEIKIARCFTFAGAHLPLNAQFAIGNFLRDAIAGTTIRIGGDGTTLRSYLYAADLAIWLWTILFKGQPLRPYNVGSEVDLSISALAALVKETLASKSPIQITQPAHPGSIVSRYVPSTARAQYELGLSERIGLSEGIIRMAQWYSNSDCKVS